MKIGIVTVYNSYNCGSFLQAFALYKLLKKNDDVYFIKNKTLSNKDRLYYRILQAGKYVLKGNLKKAVFILKKYFIFRKCRRKLPIKKEYSDIDLFIYGSDTIWNISNYYFMKEWKKYWGYGVTQKKITYAVSAGGTQDDKFLENTELIKCISEFSAISVRDEHTYSIVKKMIPDGEKVKRVVDPTLLLNVQEYKNIAKKCKDEDFILVYAFSDIHKEAIVQIRKFAQEKGKKIIAFGEDFPADKNIPYNPFSFLGYYEKADYIITNTFHGTIFSIIFNKKFVSYGKKKKKVKLLLDEFGLSNQNVGEAENISSVIEKEINYEKVNSLIVEKRKESMEYLNEFIK